MITGNLDLEEFIDRPHFSLAVALIAGMMAFVVFAIFFHTGAQNFLITTPFDGGNLSTDVGTDVEMNFYVRNTGERLLKVRMDTLELNFDPEWSFWNRNSFSSRETTSLSANISGETLEVESGGYESIRTTFTTPLEEGVFNLTLTGETSRGDFEKKVKVVVKNTTSR